MRFSLRALFLGIFFVSISVLWAPASQAEYWSHPFIGKCWESGFDCARKVSIAAYGSDQVFGHGLAVEFRCHHVLLFDLESSFELAAFHTAQRHLLFLQDLEWCLCAALLLLDQEGLGHPPGYMHGCKERASDRRRMCIANGGKPNPAEPREWSDGDEETWIR